jgi:cell division protein DivIC
MNSKKHMPKDAVSAFPRRRRGNKYGMYRLINAIGLLVILALAVIIGAQYIQQLRARQELAEYETRVLEHRERQAAIEAEIERLQEIDYIEILARDRLGLVKPGEIIFQLED